MEPMYYIELDVHKRKISYFVKDGRGTRRQHTRRRIRKELHPRSSVGRRERSIEIDFRAEVSWTFLQRSSAKNESSKSS
jgi:hypothetical protein